MRPNCTKSFSRKESKPWSSLASSPGSRPIINCHLNASSDHQLSSQCIVQLWIVISMHSDYQLSSQCIPIIHCHLNALSDYELSSQCIFLIRLSIVISSNYDLSSQCIADEPSLKILCRACVLNTLMSAFNHGWDNICKITNNFQQDTQETIIDKSWCIGESTEILAHIYFRKITQYEFFSRPLFGSINCSGQRVTWSISHYYWLTHSQICKWQ